MKGLWNRVKEFLVTGFFTGYIPFLPGTIGTLVGLGIYITLSSSPIVYYLIVILLIVISVPLADFAEKRIFQQKNSPHIVIDEIVGFQIAMVSFKFTSDYDSLMFLVIGFVLFRLFDSWKPYPIHKLKNLEGGIGIIFDDIMAGVYTNLFLQFFRILKPYLSI